MDQTKTSIREAKAKIDTARARLKQEQNDLQEARSLSQALEKRMEKLKVENEEQSHKSPEDVVNAMVQEQQQQRKHYTTDLRKLVLAFNKFVDSNLSSIIAAEDLGGPVVGDLLNITEETLKAGFNQQGKPKKASLASNTSDAKRKRRNGEVWGPEDEGEDMEPRSEKEAAAADFRTLVEDLLNASAGDEEGKTYVRIWRESAAVRFLVRAKVAHFDPGDARRLRLADFGREFDEE